jgi:hypothetical protein
LALAIPFFMGVSDVAMSRIKFVFTGY